MVRPWLARSEAVLDSVEEQTGRLKESTARRQGREEKLCEAPQVKLWKSFSCGESGSRPVPPLHRGDTPRHAGSSSDMCLQRPLPKRLDVLPAGEGKGVEGHRSIFLE